MAQAATLATNTATRITIRRLGAFLGAEVTGVDLSRPLDEATVKAIAEAHAMHEVLVFPRQEISAEDLKRFGQPFRWAPPCIRSRPMPRTRPN